MNNQGHESAIDSTLPREGRQDPRMNDLARAFDKVRQLRSWKERITKGIRQSPRVKIQERANYQGHSTKSESYDPRTSELPRAFDKVRELRCPSRQRSTHGQHTVNTRSTHGQHTVNTRSTRSQNVKKTLGFLHFCQSCPFQNLILYLKKRME